MGYLDELNEAQRNAVQTTEGPLLVLAGAGAGKTKTITHRILHLIKKGVAPQEILAVTFTNKAAKEMRERVVSLLEKDVELSRAVSIFDNKPFVATFHSLGVHILKEHSKELGLSRHFSIYDRVDSKRTIKEALEKQGYNPKEYEPGKILSIISREKGNFISSEEYSASAGGDYFGKIVSEVWQEYDAILKKENSLDFDDLILLSAKLLQRPEIRKQYSDRWQYVHIDEYQDTNKVQYAIASELVREHQNICAVGDIDQNIYSWRGANIRNILNFERDFPNTKLVVLEENYRSTQTILAIANKIIEKNKFRKEKKLVTRNAVGEKVGLFEALDENHEAEFAVAKIKELQKQGVKLSDIAVLYRANFQSRVLEEACLKGDLPYQVLGTRFFERKEIKDIISFLRLSMNQDGISDLKRVINVPPRGIGKTTLLKIVEGKTESLPAGMKIKIGVFRNLLARIKEFALENPPSKTIAFIAEETGLNTNLDKSEEGIERIENIKELVALASRYNKESPEEGVEKFLEDVSLASDQDSDKEEVDGVRLMTVHASKGLEFAYVFVVGLEEGLFPHSRDESLSEEDAEEERRLFYVAITRAKDRLFLTLARVRKIYGTDIAAEPSSFLADIDSSLMLYDETGGEMIIDA